MKKILLILLACLIFLGGMIVGFIKYKSINVTEPNKTATIVFTSDKTYKKYLKVALKSAIINKNPDTIYDINILCVDLTENDMKSYRDMSVENVKIKTIPVEVSSIKIGNFPIANTRVTRADLFKFFMPQILSEYDKVLYIDCDTVILGDLLELYNTDLSGKCLGAVLKYTRLYNWKNILRIHWYRDIEYEYNCGVMLLNLKEMRKKKITEKLIKSKNEDLFRRLMTQDAFNEVLPAKKIVKLSPVYNIISRWLPRYFRTYDFKTTYSPYLDNINSMEELFSKAVIVHYAGYQKPWFYPDVNFGKEWWKYAKMVDKNWNLEKDTYERPLTFF